MKYTMLLAAVAALCLSSCETPVPSVPDSGRTVVAPKGSTEAEKSWSTMSRQEGEAALGPLGGLSNRR